MSKIRIHNPRQKRASKWEMFLQRYICTISHNSMLFSRISWTCPKQYCRLASGPGTQHRRISTNDWLKTTGYWKLCLTLQQTTCTSALCHETKLRSRIIVVALHEHHYHTTIEQWRHTKFDVTHTSKWSQLCTSLISSYGFAFKNNTFRYCGDFSLTSTDTLRLLPLVTQWITNWEH